MICLSPPYCLLPRLPSRSVQILTEMGGGHRGPNWIHGTSENPIVPLSQLAGSALHSFKEPCPIVGPDGDTLPQHEADQLQNTMWQLVDQATEYSKENKDVIPAELSLYDYGVEKAEELFGCEEEEKRKQDEGRIRWEGQDRSKQVGFPWLVWGGRELMRDSCFLPCCICGERSLARA